MADILQQKGQNKMKEKHLPFIQKKKKKKIQKQIIWVLKRK